MVNEEQRAREIIWHGVFGYTGCGDDTADRATSAILNSLEEAGLEFAQTFAAPPAIEGDAVREACAKVAEAHYAGHGALFRTTRAQHYEHAGRQVAAAIRALDLNSLSRSDGGGE